MADNRLLHTSAETGSYLFWCPGCKCGHQFYVHKPSRAWCNICRGAWHEPPCPGATRQGVAQWTFNGNMEKPTFRPSLLYPISPRCHLHVTDGMIEYCGDCDHEFAGKTIPMEPF